MRDYVDLYADCNECDTVEGVKNYSNRIFNDILTKLNRTSKTIEDDPIYTTKDVANILCVSVRTIDEYCSNNEIGYKKSKKRRYFSRKNIDDFLNKGKRKI